MIYADAAASLNDLVDKMPPGLSGEFRNFKATSIQGCSDGRCYVIFDVDRAGSPINLNLLEVIDLQGSSFDGFTVGFRDLESDEEHIIGYTPEKLFGRNVFVSVPVTLVVKYGLELSTGERRYGYGFLVKQAHHNPFPGNTSFMPASEFMASYPALAYDIRAKIKETTQAYL